MMTKVCILCLCDCVCVRILASLLDELITKAKKRTNEQRNNRQAFFVVTICYIMASIVFKE